MSRGFNWEKVKREERVTFVPSARSQPSSSRQLNYILALCREKGRPIPTRMPLTKQRAGEMIEELLELPDRTEYAAVFPDVKLARQQPVAVNLSKEIVIELREHYPQLTPMQANSLVNLVYAINPIDSVFILEGLYDEPAPADASELLIHLTRRFLDEFAPVTRDDSALVD